jgi:hypothetical protein
VITAILPSFNEINNPIFWENVQLLQRRCDLIISEGGSQDGTWEKFRAIGGVKVYFFAGARGDQLFQKAIEHAHGDWIWLVHPNTRVTEEAIRALEALPPGKIWGAFKSKQFRMRNVFGWIAPEQCIFFSQDTSFKGRKPVILPVRL